MENRKISIINAGGQTDYVYGLVSGLQKFDLDIDLIDSDNSIGLYNTYDNVNFLNLRGNQNPLSQIFIKAIRILRYYFRLIKYACQTNSSVFHIQWLNHFFYFDRTVLIFFYRTLGKKIIYTAHNIYDKNSKQKKAIFSFFDHLTLRIMYRLCNKIIVHNKFMQDSLKVNFRINTNKVSIIPHGINNKTPQTSLTYVNARIKVGLKGKDKVMLFFGHILPNKGLDLLIEALRKLCLSSLNYRLIIAGPCYKFRRNYENIISLIEEYGLSEHVIKRIGFVPSEEVEVYFKAADCIVLPYRYIFQSGVPFLALAFGLPLIINDVGSLREVVVEGQTGFVCKKVDANELASTIEKYFNSELYKNLDAKRKDIQEYAFSEYSWDISARKTYELYLQLFKNSKF